MKPFHLALALLVLAATGCRQSAGYVGTYTLVDTPDLKAFKDLARRHAAQNRLSPRVLGTLLGQLEGATLTIEPHGTYTWRGARSVRHGGYTTEQGLLQLKPNGTAAPGTDGLFDYDPIRSTLSMRPGTARGAFLAVWRKL